MVLTVYLLRLIRSLKVAIRSRSSYLLPVGEMLEEILRDLNEKIVSLRASMKAIKFSKLLPPKAAKSRRYYMFDDSPTSQLLLLPWHVTNL